MGTVYFSSNYSFRFCITVRQLVVDLLDAYAKSTDNTIDDALVELVKSNIFPKEDLQCTRYKIY